MCQSLNEARKRERTWSIIKWRYKQMNDHNNIINCTTVQWCIRYRETIGYIPTCKDVGRVFLDYPMIRCGYGAERSMGNILQTQDLCTYEESSAVFWLLYKGLDSTKSCLTKAVWIRCDQDWSKTRCCFGCPSTHQQRRRGRSFAALTPRSLR